MAASRDLRSHVTDVVTCPICLELFNSPKSLPCLHTFCLKCIERHYRENEPGDEVACPVCRQKFNIPDRGVNGLVGNFFIAGLVEARKTASDVAVQVPCEVCLLECDDNSNVSVSTMYCVDCNQKLCELCSRPHRRMKGGPHKVVPIGSQYVETELTQTQGGKCDKHQGDDVRLYCFDCKMNICLMCFAVEHQQHKCGDVSTVAGECVKQIDADLEIVKERGDRARDEISRLEEERNKFLVDVDDVKGKLVSKSEELKKFIDAQVNELMLEVQSLKTKKFKEIESLKDSFEMKLLAFETFSAYCSELKLKGKPCDVTRAANDLHIRATDLLQNDVTLGEYRAPALVFTPMNIHELMGTGQNLIGKVSVNELKRLNEQLGQPKPNDKRLTKPVETTSDSERLLKEHQQIAPRVVHTLPGIETVFGVTALDTEVYVLRDKDKEQIKVYDTTTTTTRTQYRLVRRLSVPGGKDLYDMTSCKHYRCLYIADWRSNRCVHRVELNGKITKLSVNNQPHSLSVTSQFTVLVTCRNDSKLLELTTEGKQLREINLQSDIVHPQHATQLSNGQFVVCHGWSDDPINRVCIVDTNGHVTQSYGGPPGSATVGQLNVPCHLAVDKDEFIFVADYCNSRVLLLSPTLSFVREIVSRDQLKEKPRSLFLDVYRRRLYVAVENGVVVVQL